MKLAGLRLGRRRGAAQRNFAAIGYPKVGNTWLRMMLGHYVRALHGLAEMPLFEPSDLAPLADAGVAARGEFTHWPLTWQDQTSGHLGVENVIEPFRDINVILLVRDPLDTMVSLYMQMRFQRHAQVYSGSLPEMSDDPVLGLDKLFRFYQLWHDHMGSVRAFSLWRYEDAISNPREALRHVVSFLGEHVDARLIDDAAAFASFENMRKMEVSRDAPTYKSSGFRIFATGDTANPNALHVRRGQVGGWRDEIPREAWATLEQRVRTQMPPFYGYG